MPAPKILLTGRPGIGKTTVVIRVLEALGWPGASGFYTRELRDSGGRLGFEAITLDRRTCVLAHRDVGGPHRVGKYGVDVAAFERVAVDSIDPSQHPGATLIVVDEIGKMESFSPKFRQAVLRALDSPVAVMGTVAQFSIGLAGEIRSRGDVTLLTVTAANRDRLPGQVAAQPAAYAESRKEARP